MNGTDGSTHTASETNTTDAMRYTLGDMQSYAARMNMASVVPWDNSTAGSGKCGTTFCLTDDSATYLMYYSTGSTLGART